MKLSFTTLGCPEWDLETIVARAVEYGYAGVDFRGLGGQMRLADCPEFGGGLADTAKLFKHNNLEITCLSTSALICQKPQEAVAEIREYCTLCATLGVGFIRVFGGDFCGLPREQAIERAAQTLREAIPQARAAGVRILLETHDFWLESGLLRELMQEVNSPQVGILWDVHHPWRMLGEEPEETWRALGEWVANTHIKDSRGRPDADRSAYDYCLLGEGEVPLRRILRLLRDGGYTGCLTLEWEKKWRPEIAEPEVAFPQYVEAMRGLLAEL